MNCCEPLSACIAALTFAIAALCWCLKLEYSLKKKK
jgi:hypothetical protein